MEVSLNHFLNQKEMYLTLTTIEELPSLVALGSYSPI